MRWIFSFLLVWLAGVVAALSASGNRLLVVLEETSEKDKYSGLWKDLEGMLDNLYMNWPKGSIANELMR
jgi:oligosaccharyltransferase complex subunit beta